MLVALRACVPLKMTPSIRSVRRLLALCSPTTQLIASLMLLFPRLQSFVERRGETGQFLAVLPLDQQNRPVRKRLQRKALLQRGSRCQTVEAEHPATAQIEDPVLDARLLRDADREEVGDPFVGGIGRDGAYVRSPGGRQKRGAGAYVDTPDADPLVVDLGPALEEVEG